MFKGIADSWQTTYVWETLNAKAAFQVDGWQKRFWRGEMVEEDPGGLSSPDDPHRES